MTSAAENYQLKWHSHLSNLNASVANLYKNDKYADVMLFTSNSDECFGIPAHKLILSTCSHYFSSLFEYIHNPVSNSVINIVLPPELSKRAIQILIQYMYSGEATVSNDILNEVLRGGELLKIRGLCRNNDGNHQPTGRAADQQIVNTQQDKIIHIERNSLDKLPMPMETINRNMHKISQESPVIVMSPQHQQSHIVLSNSSHQHVQNLPPPPRSSNQNTPPAAVASSVPTITTNPTIIVKKEVAIDPANNVNRNMPTTEPASTAVSHYGSLNYDILSAIKKSQQNNTNTTIQIAKTTTNSINDGGKEKSLHPYDKKKAILRQYPASRPPSSNTSAATTTIGPAKKDAVGEENNGMAANVQKSEIDRTTSESLNFLTIKEEPVEWTEIADVNTITPKSEMEITIKPEIYSEGTYSGEEDEEEDDIEMVQQIYSPLTCELCSETFMIPADWVRHIEGHSEVVHQNIPKKRQRYEDEEVENTAALRCDLCSTYFITPGEWVRHVQNTHTETELAISNNSAKFGKKCNRLQRNVDPQHLLKSCSVCNKVFPSYASMIIHKRTHTGERPFNCNLCKKGFNVKSNLLRHMRTLHNLYQQSPGANPNKTNVLNEHESSDTD